MIGFEIWMIPAILLLVAVGLVSAGYLWGVALDIKRGLNRGEIDE